MKIWGFTFWLKKPRSFCLGFGGACTLLESRIYAVPSPHRDAPSPSFKLRNLGSSTVFRVNRVSGFLLVPIGFGGQRFRGSGPKIP